MDPLSIIAGIIAIIGAGGTVGQGLKNLAQVRHAPRLLIELRDEVSDLHLLLQSSTNLASQHESITTEPMSPAAVRGLERIQDTLLSLESLIVNHLTTATSRDGQTEVDRLAWLRSRAKIQKLKWQIQDDRQYLSTALGLLNLSTSFAQIEHQRSFFRTIENTGSAETNSLWAKKLFGYYNKDDLVSKTIGNGQQNRSLVPRPQLDLGLLKSLAEDDDEHGTIKRLALPQVAVAESPTRFASDGATPVLATVPRASQHKDVPNPPLNITRQRKCKMDCQCKCHKGNRLRSTQIMMGLLGSLSADYSLRPTPLDSCVSRRCKSSSLNINYVYPQWLKQDGLQFSTMFSPGVGPQVILRHISIRSENSPIFWAARTGALDHVVRLLSEGLASVLHINYPERKSALHIAVESMHMDIVERLLMCGADPFQQCSFGSSAIIAAGTILYGGPRTVNQRTLDKLHQLFEKNYDGLILDYLKFAPMHLACVVPSSESLDMDPIYADLDCGDVTERTALSWVAQQGKLKLLNTLLLCRAEPNKPDSSGRNALHWSILGRNVSCVESLIEFGADIFARDKLGCTPIHLAVQGEASLCIVQTLVSHGADLRARDGQGMTPLHLAAYYDQPGIVSRLLANGAPINDTDSTGRTALHIAISLNNYGVLRLLLCNSSLQCDLRDNFERNVVHFAACLGDICTLSILMATHLRNLFADDRDSTGVTGIQYAQWRLLHNKEWSDSVVESQDPDPWAWYDAFTELNMRIRLNTTGHMSEQSTDEDPHSWESLERDLTDMKLSEDEENTQEFDSDDDFDDALEVLPNE